MCDAQPYSPGPDLAPEINALWVLVFSARTVALQMDSTTIRAVSLEDSDRLDGLAGAIAELLSTAQDRLDKLQHAVSRATAPHAAKD